MGNTKKIGVSIVLDGEKEFNAAVASCNKKLATLRSELKLDRETYAENANSLEALRSRQEILTRALGEYKNKQEAVERGQQNAIAVRDRLRASVEALRKEQEQEARKLEEMKKASETSTGELEEQEKAVGELSDRIAKGNDNLQRAEDRIQKWGNKLNTAKADTLKANRALEENKKYMKEAENATDGCAASIDRYGRKVREIKVEVREAGRESVEAFGALADTIVASGLAEKTGDIAEALYGCSEAAGAFETASAKVSTIADNTAVSMEELDRQILGASSDTGQAAGEMAESAYQAISAGVDTAEAVGTAATAAKAAVGGFSDTGTVIDGLTTVMNSYGDSVRDAAEVSDIFLTVQKLGKTSVGELSASIGKVATNAANYNVSVQNLGAAYVELTKRGIQTSEATTYMNSLLKELAKNGTASAKILEEGTGKSFAELMGEGCSLAEVIDILSDSVGGNATAFANLFSSQEAGTAATVLMKAGTEEFNETLQDVTESAGATEEAYMKMAETSEYSKQKLLNGIENLKIAIGKELNESLDGLYEKGGNVIDWATEFVEKHPNVVRGVTAIAMGIGVLTVAFAGFTFATQAAIPMVNRFTAALAKNPIGAVAVAITTLITIIGTFVSMQKSAADAADKDSIAEQKNMEILKQRNEAIRENIQAAGEKIDSAEAEMYSTEKQIERLKELNGMEHKTKAQKAEMKSLVESLSGKIPELSEKYDEETGVLHMQNRQIDKLSESYKRLYLTQAAQEDLKEVYKEQYNAQKNIDEANEKIKKSQEKVNKALRDAEKAAMAFKKEQEENANNPEYNENFSKKHDDAIRTAQIYQGLQKEENEKQKEYNEIIKDSKKNLDSCNEQIRKAEKYIADYGKETDKTKGRQKKLADEAKKTAKSYTDLNRAFKKAKSGMGGWGEKVSRDVEGGFNKAVRAAKKTGTKIPDGLAKGLRDGSKSPENAINELNQATSKKLLELSENAKEAGAYIPEKLSSGLREGKLDVTRAYEGINLAISRIADKQQKKLEKSGLKISRGMKKAYERGGEDSLDAVRKADKKLEKLQKEAGVHSIEGLLKGLEEGKPRVRKALEDMADELSDSFRKKWKIHSPSREFAEIGSYAMLGIIQGTDGQKKDLQKKYREMADLADTSFRKALDIHSPSKKMAANGKYIVDGAIYGMEQEKKKLEKASAKLGTGTVQKAKKAAEKARKEAEQKENKKQAQTVKKAETAVSTKNMNAKETADAWKKAVKETKKGTDAHVKALKKYKQAREKLLKDEKKLKKDFKKTYSDYMKDLKKQIQDYRKQMDDLKKAYKEAVANTQASIAGAWGMFGKAEITKTNNASGLIRNMKTQADTIEQYKKNMDKLRDSGLSKDLIKDLESAGISSAGDVATLASMNEQQLKEYQKYYNKRQDYAKQESLVENAELKKSTDRQVKELEKKMVKTEKSYKKKIDGLEQKLKKQMGKLGVNVSDGFAEGIEKGSSSVYKAIAKMTGQTVKQVKKNLGIHSPSKVMDKLGGYTGLGFAQGLQRETENLSKILTDAIPKTVEPPNAARTAGTPPGNAQAPVMLNLYMDSQAVAKATFSAIDLMQGANIRLISRGLAR